MTTADDDTKQPQLAAHEIAKEFPPLGPAASTLAEYRAEHALSIADPSAYWSRRATELIDWYHPFQQGLAGDFTVGDITWFAGGKLNVCYNAVDRHVQAGRGDETAVIWEGDEPTEVRHVSYLDLQRRVSQIAQALFATGVRTGDVVTIYMPMIPELLMTMLACARMGATHSVVFAGFSAEALAQRVAAAASRYIVTADIGLRGGKSIPLKDIVNQARNKCNVEDILTAVLVWERRYGQQVATGDSETLSIPPPSYELKPKDVRMDPLVADQRPYSVPVWMDAEDGLFLLYTSGSTGQPKGLLHTTGGYAVYAAHTCQTSFGLQRGDKFACVADCGWITGHTYVVYGPLLGGFTTFLFESTPVYPTPGRYWDMCQRHTITQFYTAPTAIRLLMKYGDTYPGKYDMSSVRVLGTVGEPVCSLCVVGL
jgi:acetyl-CoA synthetase